MVCSIDPCPIRLTLKAKSGLFPAGADDPRPAVQCSSGVQAQFPAMLDEQIGNLVLLRATDLRLQRLEILLGELGSPILPRNDPLIVH